MSPAQTQFILTEKAEQIGGKSRGPTGRKGTATDAYAMFGGLAGKGFAIEREQVPVTTE
jgi:hypothetical protein